MFALGDELRRRRITTTPPRRVAAPRGNSTAVGTSGVAGGGVERLGFEFACPAVLTEASVAVSGT